MNKHSISPGVDAERKINPDMLMPFSEAMQAVIEGQKITRVSWDNPKYVVYRSQGKLMLLKPDRKNYPWLIEDEDMLAEDWIMTT